MSSMSESESSQFNSSKSEDNRSDLPTDIYSESSGWEDDGMNCVRMWVEEKDMPCYTNSSILHKTLKEHIW